jgi:prolyl-tRNA editing enzyme YbaK/EbsC (Cys-tRNA(Pro) deacylase)
LTTFQTKIDDLQTQMVSSNELPVTVERETMESSVLRLVAESTGGVSPLAWISAPSITIIDQALNDFDVIWAAAGHPHAVFPTSFEELVRVTGAQSMVVGE